MLVGKELTCASGQQSPIKVFVSSASNAPRIIPASAANMISTSHGVTHPYLYMEACTLAL